MSTKTRETPRRGWPTLKTFPTPAKALATAVILAMAIAMTGAMGQIIVHDIVPTFFSGSDSAKSADRSIPAMAENPDGEEAETGSRGDLLAGEPIEMQTEKPSFFAAEQFVWTLKWTHIHLFGMNMIFIILGSITIFLDASPRLRTWLVVLPFVGLLTDIAAMWLKGYVSPAFFWLHISGGRFFGAVFVYVGIRAMMEMWRPAEQGSDAG